MPLITPIIYRAVIPLLLLVAAFFYGCHYQHGKDDTVLNSFKQSVALATANLAADNAAKQATIMAARQVIEDTSNESRLSLQRLADANDTALNFRLQRDAAVSRGRAMPKTTGSPKSCDATTVADGVFLERAGKRLEQRSRQADELNIALIACQTYIKELNR